MLKIHKLTPPQIESLRAAFPALTAAGGLVTTNSIATFVDGPWNADGTRRVWTVDNVGKLLQHRAASWGGPLARVYAKLTDRPDLVEFTLTTLRGENAARAEVDAILEA